MRASNAQERLSFGEWSQRRPIWQPGQSDPRYLLRSSNPRTALDDVRSRYPSVVVAPEHNSRTAGTARVPRLYDPFPGQAAFNSIEVENEAPNIIKTAHGPAWRMQAEVSNNEHGQGWQLTSLGNLFYSTTVHHDLTILLWWRQGDNGGAYQRWLFRMAANLGDKIELSYVASTGVYTFARGGSTAHTVTLGQSEAQRRFHCFLWTTRREGDIQRVYLDGVRQTASFGGVGGISIGNGYLFTEPVTASKNKNSADGECLLFAWLPYHIDDHAARHLSLNPWLLMGGRYDALMPPRREISLDSLAIRAATAGSFGAQAAVAAEGSVGSRAAVAADDVNTNPRDL